MKNYDRNIIHTKNRTQSEKLPNFNPTNSGQNRAPIFNSVLYAIIQWGTAQRSTDSNTDRCLTFLQASCHQTNRDTPLKIRHH